MPSGALVAIADPAGASLLDLLRESGVVGKVVLAILFTLSVASWAMIIERLRTFRKADGETRAFLERFRDSDNLADLTSLAGALRFSPVVALFRSGYRELTRAGARLGQAGSGRRIQDGVQRMLERSAHAEMRRLERALSFLATVASVAPFIGLFGTVWGIMDAFRGIGAGGQSSLAASAPGIAEALITTAAGLAAAIPAVVAYNHFTRRVRTL